MEEGETVEIQETREPLREQGSIRALLELLEQQGMEQEKGDVLRMDKANSTLSSTWTKLRSRPGVSALKR